MIWTRRFIDLVLGINTRFSFEHRFINSIAIFGALLALLTTIINLGLGLGLFITIGTLTSIILFLFYYWLARIRKKIVAAKWFVSISLIILLDILWYANSASHGPILLLFIIVYAIILFLWERKNRVFLAVLFLLNLAGLFAFEYFFEALVPYGYSAENERKHDIYLSLMLYLFLTGVLLEGIRMVFVREREKALKSDRLKSAFLANMSHEIRTPMNSILGFSQLLETDINPEEKKQYLNIIKDSGMYLLQLIEDIIDISKIESEQLEIYPHDFRIDDLFEELRIIFSQALIKTGKENIALSFSLPEPALVVHTDKVRLRQVLNNLLFNAVKFTEQGSIEYGCYHEPGRLRFFVRDSGIGIDKAFHREVFERFSRIENRNPGKVYKGSGIGLSISRNLVALLGGQIWVESEPGKGSVFFFTIPHETKVHAPETPEKKSVADRIRWIGNTVLIAEDEQINFMFLKELLKRQNLRILHARDGEEAVQLFLNHPEITLVLMDIKMPKMDGISATKQIKAIRDNVPVIAQTAYAMEGDAEKSIQAGCDDYLSKPIKREKLLALLEKYLGRRGQE